MTVFGYNKITYIATINITQSSGPDPISLTVSADPTIIAQGGNAQLNAVATGGDGSFTYSWSPNIGLNNANIQNPTASPDTATTYICTVSSGGLTATDSCTVTVVCPPTNLTATVQYDNDIQLNWTAANPATTYTIYRNGSEVYNGITATTFTEQDMSPGTYNYQLTTQYQGIESPRSNTATATIYAPLTVTVTASETIIQPNHTISLSARPVGGSGNYTYSWSPANTVNNPTAQSTTTTPSETTTYTCTVTSNGQTATDSVTIVTVTPPAEFDAEIVGEEEVYLVWTEAEYADYYNLYRDGILIAHHLTDTNFTDNYAFRGFVCYELRAIYQNTFSGASSDCVFWCVPPIMVEAEYIWNNNNYFAQISWRKDVYVNTDIEKFKVFRRTFGNSEFELISEVENIDYVYDYQFNDTTATIGSYEFMVSATYREHDCEEMSEPVSCEVTKVSESSIAAKVYPNPTKGGITLEGEGLSHVRIINVYGQTVYDAKVEGEQVHIDLSQKAKGIYLIHIEAQGGHTARKIVVE